MLANEQYRVCSVELAGTMSLRVGGMPVASGELLRLAPGRYPLQARIRVGRRPPGIRIRASIQFRLVADPSRQQEDWLERVGRHQAELAAIAVSEAGTTPGDWAAEALRRFHRLANAGEGGSGLRRLGANERPLLWR